MDTLRAALAKSLRSKTENPHPPLCYVQTLRDIPAASAPPLRFATSPLNGARGGDILFWTVKTWPERPGACPE